MSISMFTRVSPQSDSATGLTDHRYFEYSHIMYKPILHLLLLSFASAILVLLPSCDLVGVQAERKNPHDPANPDYVPQSPKNIRATFLNREEQRGWIHITWVSTSTNQTGYLIERALDGETFEEFRRTESADITQDAAFDRTKEFRSTTTYRVTSYIERDGETLRIMTDPVPLSFGTIRFEMGPHLLSNRITVEFEADRVYRDGYYFKVLDPDDQEVFSVRITDEMENNEPHQGNPPRYRWTHQIDAGITVPNGSRLRISWFINEDEQEKIVGQAEDVFR